MSVHFSRGSVLYDQGKFEQALQAFQSALAEDPECPLASLMIACCYDALQMVDEAVHWSQEAVRLAPESSLAFHILGRSLYRKQGYRTKPYLEAIQTAIRYDVTDPQNYAFLSRIKAGHREWKEALSYIERALQYKPADAQYIALAGWCHFHLGHTEKAMVLLRESLRIEPSSSETHFYLAQVAVVKGDIALAKEHITESHRVDPRPVLLSDMDALPSQAYTSHDVMAEIIKSEGTLYGRLVRLWARTNHQMNVHETKLGKWAPIVILGEFLAVIGTIWLAFTLFSKVNAALANTVFLCLLGAFLGAVFFVPVTIWWITTGKMFLKPSQRRYFTDRQKSTFFALPIGIGLIGGLIAIAVTVCGNQESELKTAFTRANERERHGEYVLASREMKGAVEKGCTSYMLSAHRIQRAASQSGWPVKDPEQNEVEEKSTSKVMVMIVHAVYKEMQDAAARQKSERAVTETVAADYKWCVDRATNR